MNRQTRTDLIDPAPQVHILRVLSSLNYKLPRGSEQDSFELFEYIMSGIQEEMTKMAQESKGNDYACLIPNVETEDTTLVEVVVEKIDEKLNVTPIGKIDEDNNSGGVTIEEVAAVDASGDKETKNINNLAKLNGHQNRFEASLVPHVNHRLGYFHSARRNLLINPFIGSIASRLQCLSCFNQV